MRKITFSILICITFVSLKSQNDFLSSSNGRITEIYVNRIYKDNFHNLLLYFLDSLDQPDRLKLKVYHNSRNIKTDTTQSYISLLRFVENNSQYLSAKNKKKLELNNKNVFFETSNQNISKTKLLEFAEKIYKKSLKDYCVLIKLKKGTHQIFVQDEFLAQTKRVLFPSTTHLPHINNVYSNKFNFSIINKQHKIDGGNILFHNSLCFVGLDVLNKHDTFFIENLLNKDIIWIGSDTAYKNPIQLGKSYQPEFHLDLFMNVIYLPKIDSILFLFAEGIKVDVPDNKVNVVDFNTQIDRTIKNLTSQLENKGIERFIIDKIPFALVNDNDKRASYSYNNSFVEITSESQKIFFPKYNTINYEELISETLKKYGIEAIFIGDEFYYFDDFQNLRGSFHCLIKVLVRD